MLGLTKSGTVDTSYIDIRVGEGHGIHQIKLNAASLAASRDAKGNLPPGLPIKADGTVVAAGAAAGVIGPEPVKLGAVDTFGNFIFSGGLNRDAIEDNLARVLSAAELAGIPAALVLR